MKYSTISNHLKPYSIVAKRKTTINHAFAAAIAPHDKYDPSRVQEAMITLGQDPDAELLCVYCGSLAETWDHVFAIVKDSAFSGHGHRLGNLLPCCKTCNSAKGNKNWENYIGTLKLSDQHERVIRVKAFLDKYSVTDVPPEDSDEYKSLLAIKEQVIKLLAQADTLAKSIREKAI